MRNCLLYTSRYFYTQALRRTGDFPYVMRWPKTRQKYISCFCCPPNTLRALCEAQELSLIHISTAWDDVKFIAGYPTKYAVVARKASQDVYKRQV